MRTSGVGTSVVRCCLALALMLLLGRGVFAQSTTDGAIGGTVVDPSGAAVPNAKVTVRNAGTNAEQTVMTDESGYYRIAKLTPATYIVTISAPGFADLRAENFIVQVGSLTELSPHLSMASAGATVLVSSESAQINTTSADLSPIVDERAISNLPINGGRWSDFALLTPGVVNNASGFGLLSFRGISTLLNNNTIDGADNNQAFFSEERGRTRIPYSSAKAAVQEFQVNTSNFSAEYGRAAGGVINTVTKSGSNSYHGEGYFYDRDNEWGATNPFTKITKQTAPGVFTPSAYKPADVRKMWGFGVGGPIVKDKLFFYFAFDRYTRNFPGTAVPASPGAFFATPVADLTNYSSANSCATIIAANFTSGPNALPNGANILTATRGACTLASNLSLANYSAGVQTYNDGLSGLLGELGPVPRKGDQTIFFPKLDWQINSKNRLSAEANRQRWISPAGIQTQATNNFGIASFGNDYVRDTWGVAKLYTFLTPTLANEARFQYGRDFEFQFPQPASQYELTKLVNPAGYTNPLGLAPDVNFFFSLDIGVPTFLQRPAFPDERRTQYADTVNWIHGKHSLKFGVDVAHSNDLSKNLRFQYGSYSYSSIANYISDLVQPNQCTVTSGTPPVTNKIPCYSNFQQAFGPLGFSFSTNDLAFFGEDSWRVRPRFTLNLGLRYEYEMLPSPFSNLVNSSVPQTGNFPSDKNNFGPRVGFAWDVFGDGKTSLRGGYGIYFGRIINSAIYNAMINTGNVNGQLSFFLGPTVTNSATKIVSANPAAPLFPRILATPPTASGALSMVYFDPNFQAPQIHEVDLTAEREIGWNTVLSVSYLGSFGRQLPNFVDTNVDPTKASTITYKVADATGKGPLAAGSTYTTTLFKGPRPIPSLGSMTKIYSVVNSNYNALAVQLNHRVSHGVQFNANYTFSHALDFGQNEATFTDTNDLLDPFNLQKEYGNSNFNVQHRFVVSAILESPWHTSGWTNYLVSGWQVAPIYQVQSGLPFSLTTTGNAPGGLSSGINGSNGRKGIDVIGRNTFVLPRTQIVDLRVSKSFNFVENFRLELLGEGFNLFNRTNVTGVNTLGYFVGGTTTAPTLTFFAPFGTPSSANSNFAYSSRQVQIGVRFHF